MFNARCNNNCSPESECWCDSSSLWSRRASTSIPLRGRVEWLNRIFSIRAGKSSDWNVLRFLNGNVTCAGIQNQLYTFIIGFTFLTVNLGNIYQDGRLFFAENVTASNTNLMQILKILGLIELNTPFLQCSSNDFLLTGHEVPPHAILYWRLVERPAPFPVSPRVKGSMDGFALCHA